MKISYACLLIICLIFLAAAFFLVFIFFTPRLVSPISGRLISESEISFEFENADYVILSRTGEFEDSLILRKGVNLYLEPGTYFWKAKSNIAESEVRNFTIQTRVSINLLEINRSIEIINSGNTEENITVKNNETVVYFVINPGEYIETEKGELNIEARELE